MWETIVLIVYISSFLSGIGLMVYATVRRVTRIERKFKELLPGYKGAARLPPFFEVFAIKKPPSENGKEFLLYRKKYARESIITIAIAFGMMLAGSLIHKYF